MLRVQVGYVLHLPESVSNAYDRLWLNPGGIVDETQPHIAAALQGQLFKLEPAPAGAKPDPVPNVIERTRYKFDGTQPPPTAKQQAAQKATAAAQASGVVSSIERPSIGKEKQVKP